LPLHIHIFKQDRQVKAELVWIDHELKIVFKKIRGYKPLTNAECKEVAIFVKLYEKKIKEKWDKIMYYNQPVKAEVIKRKI
jgi:predicted SnoaL-like aldol condensation-catalyzing enzyme